MKKTLIATAILATLAATSANAGVTVFQDDTSKVDLTGRVEAGMAHKKQISDNDGKSSNTNDSYFRMGFAGESVLSEGLTAIANLEMQWDINDDGTDGNAADENEGVDTRLAYVGVKGDFGQVTFGRQQNVDVTVSDWIDNALLSGDSGYKVSSKESNVIQYNGTFDALFVGAQVQLESDNKGSLVTSVLGQTLTVPLSTNLKKSDMGLTAVYTFDFGLDLGASYMAEEFKDKDAKISLDTMLLGANYKVAGFTLGAVYGITDADYTHSGVSADSKAKGFGLSVAYEFDKVTVLARYNKSELDQDGATEDKDLVKAYTIGARYDFNDHFNVMGEFVVDQLDTVDVLAGTDNVNHENHFHIAAQYNF